MESPISRGFFGKRDRPDPSRVPPGQYVTHDFPVLSAGPTPRSRLADWTFTLEDEQGRPLNRWSWEELLAAAPSLTSRPISRAHSFLTVHSAKVPLSMACCAMPAGPTSMFIWR